MKKISLVRAGLCLWFLNFVIFSFVGNYLMGGRHSIFNFLIYSTLWLAAEMVVLGMVEDWS